jgi:tRNA pseudouridine55 synthase
VSEAWDGLLPVDKPAGPTSHDIVARVRRATGVRRVGHTGTLDPPATGLLLLMLGQATRLARFLPEAPKCYRGLLTLGVVTATDDLAGDVLRRHEGPLPEADAVQAAAAARRGRQLQVPPAVSARHFAGTRLYRLARKGVAVEPPPVEVVIERFTLTPTTAPESWSYEIVVSSGTYVRAAVRDMGAALGCGAAVASLRRTAIGPIRVENAVAVPLDPADLRDAARGGLIPIDAMPLTLSSIVLHGPGDGAAFCAGRSVALTATPETPEAGLVAVRDEQGRLYGVGLAGEGSVQPRVVLASGH